MQTQKNELNFNGQNIYVGIDVHLKSWTVTIRSEHLEHKRFSPPPNAEALHNYLTRNFPGATYYSVYESGFCGFWVHRQLEALGIHNIVVNAADVPTKQKEKVQKDDPVDSRKLARSLSAGELDAIYVPSESTLEERVLVRMRSTLVKDMTRFKNRIKSFLNFFGISYPERFNSSGSYWSKNFIKWLKEEVKLSQPCGQYVLNMQIQEVEEQRKLLLLTNRQIKALSETEKYASNVELLRSIPGIGLTVAMTILTEIETIERFENSDQFAGFVGLVPGRRNSGETNKNGEMTFRGQAKLKTVIIESSWTSARRDPALFLAYNNYVKRMESNICNTKKGDGTNTISLLVTA